MNIVLYRMEYCPFCATFKSVFERLVPNGTDKVLDNDSLEWDELNIAVVPTVIAFDGENEVSRIGARPGVGINESDFRAWLENQEKF